MMSLFITKITLQFRAHSPSLCAIGTLRHTQAPVHVAHRWQQLIKPLNNAGVPYAAVLGNHDDEGDLNRTELVNLDMCASFHACCSHLPCVL